MKRTIKFWFTLATILVVLGALITVLPACSSGGIKDMVYKNFETKTHDVVDEFSGVYIDSKTAQITFVKSEDNKAKVVCFEKDKTSFSVAVEDGTLKIKLIDNRKWFEKIFDWGTDKITVSLPQEVYGALTIKNDTGKITIPKGFTFATIDIQTRTGDVECSASSLGSVKIKTSTGHISVAVEDNEKILSSGLYLFVSTGRVEVSNVDCAGEFKVTVSTGKTKINNVTCGSFDSEGNTGDISITNFTCAQTFEIERSTGDVTMTNCIAGKIEIETDTGDVKFNECDANEIEIETDTGDVKGTLLSGKNFFVESDTGRKIYPKDSTGGRCSISTDTGRIEISIVNR